MTAASYTKLIILIQTIYNRAKHELEEFISTILQLTLMLLRFKMRLLNLRTAVTVNPFLVNQLLYISLVEYIQIYISEIPYLFC